MVRAGVRMLTTLVFCFCVYHFVGACSIMSMALMVCSSVFFPFSESSKLNESGIQSIGSLRNRVVPKSGSKPEQNRSKMVRK